MATKKKNVGHYPTLKTIRMVEEAIKAASQPIRRIDLKRKLRRQVMHRTLNTILEYLGERNAILDTHKGIIWLEKPNAELLKALKEGIRL